MGISVLVCLHRSPQQWCSGSTGAHLPTVSCQDWTLNSSKKKHHLVEWKKQPNKKTNRKTSQRFTFRWQFIISWVGWVFLRSTFQDIKANCKTSMYFHKMAHKAWGGGKFLRPLEKEKTTGIKMTLQLREYIVTSLKRKVNRSCYFATFFPYKKDEDLSFFKVGCFILKESRKKTTYRITFRARNFSSVISQFFPQNQPYLYYKVHTVHICITTETITWHTCTEMALQRVSGPETSPRFLSWPRDHRHGQLCAPRSRKISALGCCKQHLHIINKAGQVSPADFPPCLHSIMYKGLRLPSKQQLN